MIVGITGQLERCVRRQALTSVQMHPQCRGEVGEAAVTRVFDRCYRDLAPFVRHPRYAHQMKPDETVKLDVD